jgi:hypothetical protein
MALPGEVATRRLPPVVARVGGRDQIEVPPATTGVEADWGTVACPVSTPPLSLPTPYLSEWICASDSGLVHETDRAVSSRLLIDQGEGQDPLRSLGSGSPARTGAPCSSTGRTWRDGSPWPGMRPGRCPAPGMGRVLATGTGMGHRRWSRRRLLPARLQGQAAGCDAFCVRCGRSSSVATTRG